MRELLNLTGQRFGSLTVTGEAPRPNNKQRAWHCVCDCGNTDVAIQHDLRQKKKKMCRECGRKVIGKARALDLSGRRFGMLLVLGKNPDASCSVTRWNTVCDCGRTRIAATGALRGKQAFHCVGHYKFNGGQKKPKPIAPPQPQSLLTAAWVNWHAPSESPVWC
jgi:hypothetical protein